MLSLEIERQRKRAIERIRERISMGAIDREIVFVIEKETE